MNLALMLLVLFTCHYETFAGSMNFILYNDTSLLNLFVYSAGFFWETSPLKINAFHGLQVNPVTKAVMWNEDGILTTGHSTGNSSSKVWVPERLGHIFHYDWKKNLLYWYEEENQPQETLKAFDLDIREVYGIKTIQSGTLKTIDSINELFVYNTDDSLKMYAIDSLEEKYSIQIDDEFKLMDVIPNHQLIVLLQTIQKDDSIGERFIKIYSYEGEELHSMPANEEYESIHFQEPLLVAKYKYEITVFDIKSKKILFKTQKDEFTNMKLKLFHIIDEDQLPVAKTVSTFSECKETDYQEVCVLDEGSDDEGDQCIHQSYIISDGTSFKHYNPASKNPPFPLPFKIPGSIRKFATYKRQRIFWINNDTDAIMMNYIYMDTQSETFNVSTVSPSDLKVDEKQKHIFWSDEGKGTIEMSDLDGLTHKVLFSHLNLPRRILLALDYGSLIWMEGENNDTIVIGLVAEGSKKVLFQSNEPIFGFAFDYIYNILYVGSQSDQLIIHAVNSNLGFKRRIFKSKIATRFSNAIYSRNNLYLWGSGMFWKFHPWNQKLIEVYGGAFNTSLVSPIECSGTQTSEQACENCRGLCLAEGQGSLAVVQNYKCLLSKFTSKGFHACSEKEYLFAVNKKSVFRLSERVKCTYEVYWSRDASIKAGQPISYDSRRQNIFVAESNHIYQLDLQSESLFDLDSYGSDVYEMVFMDVDNRPIVKYSNGWRSYSREYSKLNIPSYAKSVITYPTLDIFFYIYDNTIYCHGTSSSDKIKIVSIPSQVDVIRISYEENRIYYWSGKTLHSLRLDGKKPRQMEFNVPSIKTFAFLNRVMYFVSGEDNLLYKLNHLSKDETTNIKLVNEKPGDIFNLINYQGDGSLINDGCEGFKDDDGDCFYIYI